MDEKKRKELAQKMAKLLKRARRRRWSERDIFFGCAVLAKLAESKQA